jgi:hypothetical protein
VMTPATHEYEFAALPPATIALGRHHVPAAKVELEAKGLGSGSVGLRRLQRRRRQRSGREQDPPPPQVQGGMSRATPSPPTRLPLPDTTEEHWRFTDLRGFDPDHSKARVQRNRDDARPRRRQLRDRSPPTGSTSKAPEGSLRAAAEDTGALLARRLGSRSSRPTSAALWQHRLLVVVRRASSSRSRSTSISATGQTVLALVVVVGEGAGRPDRGSTRRPLTTPRAYSNAVTEGSSSSRPRSSSTSPEPLARDGALREPHARVERDAELDWVAGGFGSKKGKTRIQNGPQRPRGTPRVTGRVLRRSTQHLDYDTFRSTSRPTARRLRLQGALRRGDGRCGAG